MADKKATFRCSTCGEIHDITEISFGAEYPLQWDLLTEEERKGSLLGEEQCIIDGPDEFHYYIRACLDIPIKGTDDCFSWGVWVSLNESDFKEMFDNLNNPERSRLGPYFGWLSTKIPEYPDTMFLKVTVYQRAIGVRPLVELEPTDHPLAVQQRAGIELEELQELVVKILHDDD